MGSIPQTPRLWLIPPDTLKEHWFGQWFPSPQRCPWEVLRECSSDIRSCFPRPSLKAEKQAFKMLFFSGFDLSESALHNKINGRHHLFARSLEMGREKIWGVGRKRGKNGKEQNKKLLMVSSWLNRLEHKLDAPAGALGSIHYLMVSTSGTTWTLLD